MALSYQEIRAELACSLRWAARLGFHEGVCNHITVSVQTLQQSVYENHTTPAPQPVTFDRVAAYLLQRCASVADVAAALRGVAVVDNPLFAKLFGRCHWSVADSSGTSAVVEYLEGRLSIHDNSRGLCGNGQPVS